MSVSIAQFRTGELVVSHLYREPQLLLYDRNAKYLRSYTKRGAGPGEFSSTLHLVLDRNDTLYAFENLRVHRFDRELKHIDTRSIEKGVQVNGVVLADGRMVVDDRVRTNDRAVYTVQIVDREGQVTNTLERVANAIAPTLLAPAADGRGFWTARRNETELREYDSKGDLVRTVTVRPPWFTAWNQPIPGEPLSARPRPRNAEIMTISAHHVMLVTIEADSKWKPIVSGPPGKIMNPFELDGSAIWDTVVSAVDVRTANVIAQVRSPELLHAVEGGKGLVYSTSANADGHVDVHIWQVELVSVRSR
ncbi:MAG: hypothetical protein ACRENP_10580 [Longimicrobiales bacterium]